MGSIVISTTSPGQRNFGGLKPIPTPSGVPVAMISPGSNVMPEERVEISLATEKIKSVVLPSWRSGHLFCVDCERKRPAANEDSGAYGAESIQAFSSEPLGVGFL